MTIISAFLMPGLPHPLTNPEPAPWRHIGQAAKTAGAALKASEPDTLVVYSTQWIAVLDQLWQTRPVNEGVHVDENWYEFGDIPFRITADVPFAEACIAKTPEHGFRSKAVNYEGFPVDTGTLVAQHFLNENGALPVVSTSNNVYHDWNRTEALGKIIREVSLAQNKRVAIIGVGGLSARMFRAPIDPAQDHFADESDDDANRAVIAKFEEGDADGVRKAAGKMAADRPTDFGLKHLAFLLGAIGPDLKGAKLHGYGPIYGTGAAVVEMRI